MTNWLARSATLPLITLKDCFVILGNKFTRLGDLAPGAEAKVELDLASLGAPNFSSPLSYAMFDKELNGNVPNDVRRQAEAKRSIIENLFERTPPYISSTKSSGSRLRKSLSSAHVCGLDGRSPPTSEDFWSRTSTKDHCAGLDAAYLQFIQHLRDDYPAHLD